jgi:hypothetical protein
MEGFDSPPTYAVYKSSGGSPLGVVGGTKHCAYRPMDLEVMLDSIVSSIVSFGDGISLDNLSFEQYSGGSKVAFKIELPTIELKRSPMVGDILKRWIEFRTGFDGKTTSSVTETFKRVWCSNGCSSMVKGQNLAFKNTTNNHIKIYNLTEHIAKSLKESERFAINLDRLADIDITREMKDSFISKVTGYNVKEYKELTTRKQNILDRINRDIGIEMSNTGSNLFSLVNGITRYTTHEVSRGDETKLFYSSADTMNKKALNFAFSNLN